MVSALDSGASAPGSSPGRGHCVVFLGKTLYSHGALTWSEMAEVLTSFLARALKCSVFLS